MQQGHDFTLGTARLTALPSGALWWAEAGVLCVSDLHLGKSERLARRGGALLPPYDAQATLEKLEADITSQNARHVICLGDSFDDLAAAQAFDEGCRLWLLRLMAGREWTWIEGNHDAGPLDLAGEHLAEWACGSLVFRHIATGQGLEISGHYHPKARLAGKSHPCFLYDDRQVVMPAYGRYTGGLWAESAPLATLLGDSARAVLTGKRCLVIPMPRPQVQTGRIR